MALNTDEIEWIATLAGLRWPPRVMEETEETEGTRRALSRMQEVLSFVDRLASFEEGSDEGSDGSQVEPVQGRDQLGAPQAAQAGAPDVPAPCLPRETVLAEAPASQDGFFLVPRVLPTEAP